MGGRGGGVTEQVGTTAGAGENTVSTLASHATAVTITSLWSPEVDLAKVSRAITTARGEATEEGGAADVVLVDAPCSSLGTLRRGPNVRCQPPSSALISCCYRVVGRWQLDPASLSSLQLNPPSLS